MSGTDSGQVCAKCGFAVGTPQSFCPSCGGPLPQTAQGNSGGAPSSAGMSSAALGGQRGPISGLAVDPSHLTDQWKRLGGAALDVVLVFVTLGIGYIVWAIILLWRGQTPAMQIMKMRTVDCATGRQASAGKMFVRNVLVQGLCGLFLVTLVGGAITMFMNDRRQTVWDMAVDTTIVDDPQGLFAGKA